LIIALAFFFIQTQRVENKVIENNRLIEEIQEKGAAIIVVPELPESEFETPYAPPPEELEGAPEPDPVSDKEKPRSKIRVFRGAEVTEYEL
jgi:predicted amidohydrolase